MNELISKTSFIRNETITRRFVLASLLVVTFIVAMSTTILNTVGPVITEDIGGGKYYAWVFAIYTVLSTITIPIFGKLSDCFGRKNIFLICTSLFVLSSLFCGFSSSVPMLIIFRALQGIGAGGMAPVANVIISDMLPIQERGKYHGHFSLIWGMSAFLGPTVGAAILEFLDWRWTFFVNIPLGLFAITTMLFYQEKTPKKVTPINFASASFLTIAIFAILTITIDASLLMLLLPLATIAFILFFRIEKKTNIPFLPIGILKNKSLLFLNLNTFLFFLATFGLESFIPYFLQKAQGCSVMLSGIILGGVSLGWTFSSYPSGKIVLKYGYKKPILTGNLILTLSCIPFFFYTENTSMWLTFGILVIHGFCYGLIQTTATLGSYEMASDEEKVFASSLQSFSRNIGTAFSLGLMGGLVVINPFYILYSAASLALVAFAISIYMAKQSESF